MKKDFTSCLICILTLMLIASLNPIALYADENNRIQPYKENPRYWQYKGEPVLLRGGSRDDNLFQLPDLETHLDSLVEIGGNYIRNTMSARQDKGFEVQPFAKLSSGKYDLHRWNTDYWQRFQQLLQITEELDIIVQIELWALHDFNQDNHLENPWHPDNNVNYSHENTRLKNRYGHIRDDDHDFFFTVPALQDDREVLRYQQRFVEKILNYSLKYNHVLYCVTNEIFPNYSPAWSQYWAQYVRDRAKETGKNIEVTEMFWQTDLKDSQHEPSLNNPELFTFFEISQNSANSGETNWEYTQYIRNQLNASPRPVNAVKIYGGENDLGWTGSGSDAVNRFWRNLLGGCAASRFHRPVAGIGFSDKAQASLRAVRTVEKFVKFRDLEPATDLLTDREEDEAYLATDPGSSYLLYYTDGGEVNLNLGKYDSRFQLNWINISTGVIEKEITIRGGETISLTAPGNGQWLAVLTRQ